VDHPLSDSNKLVECNYFDVVQVAVVSAQSLYLLSVSIPTNNYLGPYLKGVLIIIGNDAIPLAIQTLKVFHYLTYYSGDFARRIVCIVGLVIVKQILSNKRGLNLDDFHVSVSSPSHRKVGLLTTCPLPLQKLTVFTTKHPRIFV